MGAKLKTKYIIVNESDWDDILEIGKRYRVRYDEYNSPYILNERIEECYDIFNFEDDFELLN